MIFRATVLTLYPEMFPGALGLSLAGRRIVHRAMPIGGEIADLHGLQRPCSGFQRPAGQRCDPGREA